MTVRLVRPARARRPAGLARRCRGRCGRCPRSPVASTCRRSWRGCASWTGAPRCGCAGRAPSSTRCATTSWATTSGRSTGGPPPGAADVVVRTWRPERDRHILVVLDTGRTSAGRVGDAPRLDAAMDAALLLTALAAQAGDRVDLLAYDRRARAERTGQRAVRSCCRRFVNAMATLEPELVELDATGLVSTILRRVSHRSLVVLLTGMTAGRHRGRAAARPATADEAAPVAGRRGRRPPGRGDDEGPR